MLPLLIICIAIIYVCAGYYIVAKIDTFISGNNYIAEPAVEDEKKDYPVAVVFGNTELAKRLSILLSDNQIHMLHLTDPFFFEKDGCFSYLFALSENDADNIVLCKIGRKIYDIERLICICNDIRNRRIYEKEKITCYNVADTTAQMLYDAVIVGKAG